MGCEALLKGAEFVLSVERNSRTASLCQKNLLNSYESVPHKAEFLVIRRDALLFLKAGPYQNSLSKLKIEIREKLAFDIVYLDPPYSSGMYLPVLNTLLEENWLNDNGLVICEYFKENELKAPKPWKVCERRFYGNSALLIISPPENYSCDTGSKHQQIDPIS